MSWGYRSAFLEIMGKSPILWNDSRFLVFIPFKTMERKIDRWADHSAFTLIELLIAVTIIAIIGIVSISWFSRMTQVQDAETTIKVVANALDSFDRAVMRHRIASYDVIFETGSIGFAANLDGYRKTTPTEYSFDFINGSGVAKSTDTSAQMWELNFFTYDTSWDIHTLPASGGIQPFSFPRNIQKRWFGISSGVGDRVLNSYIMQYYNLTNIRSLPENEVRLVGIVWWNNVPYASLTVRNILGKKVLQGSGTTLDTLEKATLSFEKNGKEMQMVLLP